MKKIDVKNDDFKNLSAKARAKITTAVLKSAGFSDIEIKKIKKVARRSLGVY